MRDGKLNDEFKKLIKSVSNSGFLFVSDNLYFILPRLRDAAAVLSKRADTYFLSRLEKRLRICSYAVDFDGLCGFLRGADASDLEVRNVRAYLTVCYCRRLCDGHDVTAAFREADKLDFALIVKKCSPLEARLSFYPDYEESDDATKAEYRAALYKTAEKDGRDPCELLNSVPPHKITSYLFPGKRPFAALYFLSVGVLTLLLIVLLYSLTHAPLLCFLSSLPLYEFSVFVICRVFSRFLPAKKPMRLSEDAKIPPYLITVTALLGPDAEETVKTLENLCFSEGRNKDVYFGLLGDLPDSDKAETPEDGEIIKKYSELINGLRCKYGNRFFLFYRKRKYSVGESRYIAPERKRGAVCELVKQIRTGSSDLLIEGDASSIYNIPYIITLDSDTLLYPGSSDMMIRAAYHPYNRPKIDRKKRVVTSGHAIFQPRIRIKLPDEKSTYFSRAFFPDNGVDCYGGADFDIFGSVFSSGVFCGKGVIDTEAFYICACSVFPRGKILSHDAAEGCRCRCGALSDVIMYEESPKNALSYFRRLDRWIRGDVQSLILCGKSFKGPDGKTKQCGTTVFHRYVLIGSVIRDITPVFSVFAVISALFYRCLPVASIFALSYIYLPELSYIIFGAQARIERAARICRLFLRLSALFYECQTALFAVCTAVFRLITGKNLLKWTTASVSDKMNDGAARCFFAFLPSLFFGVALIFFSAGAAFLTGTAAAFSMITAYMTSKSPRPYAQNNADTVFLTDCIRDHFRYFTDFVTAEHGYLPPDNFQQFGGAVVAARTSPTNIGLYLLSAVAAADTGIIDKSSVYGILSPTLETLGKLPKHNGKLYNWYDTRTLSAINGCVSSVDCGNYLCCLITLYNALSEYEKYDPRNKELKIKICRLIEECDLSELYDKKSGLFRICEGDGSDNCYDLYISEMHTTDILAAALGFAPVSHISRLGRPVSSDGDLRGLVSWGGTAFEYFMPSLFLPAPDGSMIGSSLRYAYLEQKKHGAKIDGKRIFGISESCYFSFDRKMNYQYKAHGVAPLSLSANGNEPVFSPYSAFLMLGMGKNAEKSLKNMKAAGLYGEYGFYEAVDLSPSRVGGGRSVIRCFMAHHIGMSIVAAANRICGDIFVKRFCSDPRIAAYLPLLYEKMPSGKSVLPKKPLKAPPQRVTAEYYSSDAAAVTNTVCTILADKSGAGLYRKDVCVCDPRADILRRLTLLCRGPGVFDLLSYPYSFSENGIEYRRNGMSAFLSVSENLPVYILDVSCSDFGCALCFEPILEAPAVHGRHAAYSSLFVAASYENGVLTVKRRSASTGFCIAAATASGDDIVPLRFLCRADSFHNKSLEDLFETSVSDKPGACVFPRLLIKTGRGCVRFYIAAANTEEEAKKSLFAIITAKRTLRRDKTSLPPTDGALFCRVLKSFLRQKPKTASQRLDRSYKGLLYRGGISGDRPIMLIDCRGEYGISRLRSVFPKYAQVFVRALICGIDYDIVAVYDNDDTYYGKKRSEIRRLIGSLGLDALYGDRIFALEADSETSLLLSDLCFYSVCPTDMKTDAAYEPQKNTAAVIKRPDYKQTYFEDGAAVVSAGGSFLPQSFIYANRLFGALVTDRSGGFCWYVNSRMMRLTDHDTVPGGTAEKITLYCGGKSAELFSSAETCRFYLSYAEWSGHIGDIPYTVTLSVDPVLPYKVITVKCAVTGDAVYSAEPVIGEKPVNGTLRFAESRGTVFISNAYEPGRPEMFINPSNASKGSFDGKVATVRAEFRGECTFTVGAVRTKAALDLMFGSRHGAERRYAERVNRFLSPFTLHSPDRTLDMMFNAYAPYQALFCRTYGRCGHYQLGGAYGFRDQLQDCLCTVYGSAADAKTHILRCAAHQYLEGDVMHWFHPLTETGVRTRCSDDMLWLIIAVGKYIDVTGDTGILDFKVRYLESAPLSEHEADRYEAAVGSAQRESVLHHCKRAADRIRTGGHGLCLIGGGDWNDGMNLAGIKGRGESVWLSFFAASALTRLSSLCLFKNDPDHEKYGKIAAELIAAAEKYGFDGDHYIRGYLDNGVPFGKTGDGACEIDILPQSAAAFMSEDKERVKRALDSAYGTLFDAESGIFRLFYPPFDGQADIGYITAYPPGIRENGGQYTHGAIWGAMGYLHADQTERGYEILRAVNPMNKTDVKYGAENYVFCGDVYTAEGVYGRGGWSWYTGSAAWYFCAVLEHLLGYREAGGGFYISPSFCSDFSRFTLTIRRHGTQYTVRAENVKKQNLLDGAATSDTFFPFDRGVHTLDLGIN